MLVIFYDKKRQASFQKDYNIEPFFIQNENYMHPLTFKVSDTTNLSDSQSPSLQVVVQYFLVFKALASWTGTAERSERHW